ncbi:MAG: preprotein translocase subunit SecE [Actinomycetota bacterium]
MPIVRFFTEVMSELRRVTWPTGEVVANHTTVALATVAVATVLFTGLDGVFGWGVLSLLRP